MSAHVLVPVEMTSQMIDIWQEVFHNQLRRRHKARFSPKQPESAEQAAWRAVLKHCAKSTPEASAERDGL